MRDQERVATVGQAPLGFWTPFWSVSSVIGSAAIHAFIYRFATNTKELFQGFGADLPMFSEIVLATYPYFPALILIGLVPSIILVAKRHVPRDEVSWLIPFVAVSFGLSLALIVITAVATYMPIFAMGSAVN